MSERWSSQAGFSSDERRHTVPARRYALTPTAYRARFKTPRAEVVH
ncbi:hypothetical protein RN347_02230 [Halomonas sp. PAMB 3264]|nr:hypothetical protein [Halomonas sp. PAMB 3264]WNL42732.1 hypothetical protein RN347_02230 [Halomonas sp. PAMB 3264]